MPPASTSGCSGVQIVLYVSHIGNITSVILPEGLLSKHASSKHTIQKTLTCFLGVWSSFLLSCLQVTKNFNQMKDRAWKACCQRELLCYFTTFWAITVIWLKWKAGIFLTRGLSQVWDAMDWGIQEPPRCVFRAQHRVWPMELGARHQRSCEDSASWGDKALFLTICWVEFPFRVILVKSRVSYIGCWWEFGPIQIKNPSFPLNTSWIIFYTLLNSIKLLVAGQQFSKTASWICDGKIQAWQR